MLIATDNNFTMFHWCFNICPMVSYSCFLFFYRSTGKHVLLLSMVIGCEKNAQGYKLQNLDYSTEPRKEHLQWHTENFIGLWSPHPTQQLLKIWHERYSWPYKDINRIRKWQMITDSHASVAVSGLTHFTAPLERVPKAALSPLLFD